MPAGRVTLNTTICCSVKGTLLGPYSAAAAAALLVLAAPFSCMHVRSVMYEASR